MAAARRPLTVKCPACKGQGDVDTTVTVGRKNSGKSVKQAAMCMTCLGSKRVPAQKRK
ncbi:hypothetical protein [Yinghuangia sp. YIM S09857]|uniref:hypothetical protein n=1 Tax=Yinghuangia sp. YIM S09857 TaxID=3436929 RepID=UPI003F52E041